MTVYVDNMRAKFGRMIMCHMIADSDDELHAFAASLGLKRSWHQAPPKASHSHYDISLSVRAKAVSLGAVEITWRQTAFMCRRRKLEGVLGRPEEVEEWWATRNAKQKEKATLT